MHRIAASVQEFWRVRRREHARVPDDRGVEDPLVRKAYPGAA
ncbi:hypothetical protein [Streptomyces goshikiensis]